MGLTHVTVIIKATLESEKKYEDDFLVDAGSADCMVAEKELKKNWDSAGR